MSFRQSMRNPCATWCIYEGEVPVSCTNPFEDFFGGRTISLIVPRYVGSAENRADKPLTEEMVVPRCLVNIVSRKTIAPSRLRRRIRYGVSRKAKRAAERLRDYEQKWWMINRHFARVFGVDIVKYDVESLPPGLLVSV